MNPLRIILVGLVLVLIGVLVPFLIVIDIIAPSYLFGLVSFVCSLTGVLLGVVGASWYRREQDR